MPTDTTVISLGGSIIAPSTGPNAVYISKLVHLFKEFFSADRRFFLICGGGVVTRLYQDNAEANIQDISQEELDWIGIRATHVNAEFVKAYFGKDAYPTILTDYEGIPSETQHHIVVGGGWKPGWSTDYVSVRCAELLDADTILNLTNTPYVYDSDPTTNPHAQPYNAMSWPELIEKVGTVWKAGMRAPFDPIASQKAYKLGKKVIIADGCDLENLRAILEGKSFEGTTIS